jgi:galactokinase
MITSFAPGRAELLGNHTDYNAGLVLSIAVDRGVRLAGTVRADGKLIFRSRELGKTYEGSLDALAPSAEHPWANYLLGVFDEFRRRDLAIGGAELEIASNLPLGAGLSSSAALETSTAFWIQKAFGHALPPLELAKIGQASEHRFVGVKCGLLDQISSIFGKAGQATFIDCRSFEVRNLPIPAKDKFVIANSGVKHSLVASEYNQRRAACEAAAQAFGVPFLRDVDSARLEAGGGALPPDVLKRARHIVGENERVAEAAGLLARGEAAAFGQLMFDSHESSRVNFENSCPELDRLVEAARRTPGCLGARLSGGGFGGATINLVEAGAEAGLIAALEAAVPGTVCLVTAAADGARIEG